MGGTQLTLALNPSKLCTVVGGGTDLGTTKRKTEAKCVKMRGDWEEKTTVEQDGEREDKYVSSRVHK